jgi:hypothetical protein
MCSIKCLLGPSRLNEALGRKFTKKWRVLNETMRMNLAVRFEIFGSFICELIRRAHHSIDLELPNRKFHRSESKWPSNRPEIDENDGRWRSDFESICRHFPPDRFHSSIRTQNQNCTAFKALSKVSHSIDTNPKTDAVNTELKGLPCNLWTVLPIKTSKLAI